MTQCCYKTHREDSRNFPKIDAVATSQLLRGNTKGISNQYPNATGEYTYLWHVSPNPISEEMGIIAIGIEKDKYRQFLLLLAPFQLFIYDPIMEKIQQYA